jgi:hypothetical protein
MSTERSDKLHENYQQAVEKFDYFVLAVTGALCTYISQVYKPAKIDVNPATLELLSLLLLVGAAVAGFRRVERTIQVTILNHRYLRTQEEKGALSAKANGGHLINESTGEIFSPGSVSQRIEEMSRSIPIIRTKLEAAISAAERSYKTRNALLFIGFCSLVASKVWSAY